MKELMLFLLVSVLSFAAGVVFHAIVTRTTLNIVHEVETEFESLRSRFNADVISGFDKAVSAIKSKL